MTLEPKHSLLILLMLLCVLMFFIPNVSKAQVSYTVYTKDVPTFVHRFFNRIDDIQKKCENTYDMWDEVRPCKQWRLDNYNLSREKST